MGDIRLAVRSLLRSKLFTAVAVMSLAIGIGATTSVFSVFSAIALRSLPFPDASRIVDVEEWSKSELCEGCTVGVSLPMFDDLSKQIETMSSMAAYIEVPVNIGGTDAPERVGGALVSGNFFRTLALNPVAGRTILDSDDEPGATPVVVLSDRLFRRRFLSDTSVVGQSIRINGRPTTVVGVMPPSAVLPEFADVWSAMRPAYHVAARSSRELGVIGRLKGSATVAQASAEMSMLAAAIAHEHPETQRGWTTRVRTLREAIGGREVGLYAVMLGAVVVLLSIVCANIAGLLLARGVTRRRDIAVRLALGASRRSVIWHLLTESLCLGIAGGVLGIVAASWTVDLLLASLDTQVPTWLDPHMDAGVIAFAVLVSAAAAVTFGMVPALRATQTDIHDDLKSGALGTIGGGGSRLRGALVVAQLALSLIMLAGAGVLTVAVRHVGEQRAGPDNGDVITGNVDMLGDRTLERDASTVRAFIDRLSDVPGVRSAAAHASGFIAGFGAANNEDRIVADGVGEVRGDASPRFYQAVTPNYFETMRIALNQGRRFSDVDVLGSAPVIIVNQGLAHRLWPTGDVLGKRIRLGRADSLPWRTVIGVVGDYDQSSTAPSEVYVPFDQTPQNAATLFIGTSTGDPLAVSRALREAARTVDPDVPVLDLMTIDEQHARQFWPYRAYALTMSAFGLIALLLAAIGLYGVVAYAAEQRTREIGLRMALGARRIDVLRLITGKGLGLVATGILLGIAGAAAVLPIMRSSSMLFGVSPFNPIALGGSILILVVVALIASYLPAGRAARVDPTVALRSE